MKFSDFKLGAKLGTAFFAVVLLTAAAMPAFGSFHTFVISEVYSSADGTVQFIELREGSGFGGQHLFSGQSIVARNASGLNPRTLVFAANLPSSATANRRVLIATAAFAALPGAPTPDYIIPANFLYFPAGRVQFAGLTGATQNISYASLPNNGTSSIVIPGATIGANTPTNFAGTVGAVNASTGGCCLQSGSCQLLSLSACGALTGSTYRGDGTTCTAANCPAPTGACCLTSGECQSIIQSACSLPGAVWSGPGTVCTPNPCAQPTGACCLSGSSCAAATMPDCLSNSGTYQGDGSMCLASAAATCCPANVNHDDSISADDIFAFLDEWFGDGTGPCMQTHCHGDYDDNGFVGADDIFAFLDDWFSQCE